MHIRTYILTLLACGFSMMATAKDYNVLNEKGLVSDGSAVTTRAIQSCIDRVSSKGGGRIVFPRGIYLSGSLMLKSGVEIHLEEGAVLLGSTNPDDYYYSDGGSAEIRNDENAKLALIMAVDAKNIALSGKGIIDGQGLELALHIDSLHHAGVRIDPHYNQRRLRPDGNVRPKMFAMTTCEHLSVRGLTIRNSACWGLSFDRCSDLQIDGIRLTNRAYWNNDGIDITDCHKVSVAHCTIDAADDGICLKSHDALSYNDSITISDCEIRSSASAIKFGTASWGGFKHVVIDNIRVFDTFRSAIAIESVDGAVIDDVKVSNLVAKNTGNAIFVRLGHRAGEKVGVIRNISIRNVSVEVPFGRPDINYDLRGPEVDYFHNPWPSSLVGIPGHAIENVILENIEIVCPGRATKGMAYMPLSRVEDVPEAVDRYPEFSMFGELPSWGFYIRHVKNIRMNNIRLRLADKDFRPAIVMDDVKGYKLEEMTLPQDASGKIFMHDCLK